MSHRLLSWARRWFDPETVARFFEPLIADWQHEHQDAAGPLARIIATVRGTATFLFVACWMAPRRLAAPIPMNVFFGVLVAATLFCVPVTLLLMLPYLSKLTDVPADVSFLWFAYLLPSTAAIALPLSMVVIVDRIRRDAHTPDFEKPRLVTQFALLVAVVMVVALGWVVPYANQDWREALASVGRASPIISVRGLRELTLVELFGAGRVATAEIWNRILLMVLPLLFAVLRWTLPPIVNRFAAGRVAYGLWFMGMMLTFSYFRLTGFSAGFARGPYPMGFDGLLALVLGMAVISSAFPQGDWPGHNPLNRSRGQSITR